MQLSSCFIDRSQASIGCIKCTSDLIIILASNHEPIILCPQCEKTRKIIPQYISNVKHPTMVSFDLETTTGVKRAFDALPDNKEKKLVKY